MRARFSPRCCHTHTVLQIVIELPADLAFGGDGTGDKQERKRVEPRAEIANVSPDHVRKIGENVG